MPNAVLTFDSILRMATVCPQFFIIFLEGTFLILLSTMHILNVRRSGRIWKGSSLNHTFVGSLV
ncbi:hypothetical protein D917_07111 [Trichinella nativa]|uniref:Uncharacterized protein n=1 Tax=Trichinella nativa TaxID=6335 RepID=A0A1Y3EPX5_9BILA|nr:hypothetical protein D917_07111 [Trichinella nativa]